MSEYERQIDAIYKRIPKIKCKGRCQDYCGPVTGSVAEMERMGGQPGCTEALKCSHLNGEGRCRVYKVRPAVCRLFGTIKNPVMSCPHGCRPERWLTDEEARQIFADLDAIAPALDWLDEEIREVGR